MKLKVAKHTFVADKGNYYDITDDARQCQRTEWSPPLMSIVMIALEPIRDYEYPGSQK